MRRTDEVRWGRAGKRSVAECGGLNSAQKRRRGTDAGKPIEISIPAEIQGSCTSIPPNTLRSGVVVVNIDDSVEGNQGRGNIEYAADTFSYYRLAEAAGRPNPQNWRRLQTEITSRHREIVIDWLVEVVDEWKLRRDTLHLTVNLMDRILSARTVPKNFLQLLGITCLWLSSKFIEVNAPSSACCAAMTGNTYTKEEVRNMELEVLRTIDYDLAVPTTATYVERYVRAAKVDMPNAQVEGMARYLVDLSFLEIDSWAYRPSALAAAAVFLARYRLGNITWTPTLERHTGYSLASLPDCCAVLLAAWRRVTESSWHGMRKRFCRGADAWVTSEQPLDPIPEYVFHQQP